MTLIETIARDCAEELDHLHDHEPDVFVPIIHSAILRALKEVEPYMDHKLECDTSASLGECNCGLLAILEQLKEGETEQHDPGGAD